jgi:hypothetical protein
MMSRFRSAILVRAIYEFIEHPPGLVGSKGNEMMHTPLPRHWPILTIFAVAVSFVVAAPAQAQVAVSFDKAFIPATIGPGSVATLRFDIANVTAAPVTDLAFTDNLPAAVVIASVPNAQSTCGGTLTALGGSGTITFTDGLLGASGSCSIFVDVASSTPGTHTNTSGDLTSSAGNSGPATDDLIVDIDLPGFIKSFTPNTVPLGGRSTLTFTIDNTANGSSVPNLDFTDILPVGMVIAAPANASTTCGTALIPPILTAVPGTTVISLNADGIASFPAVAAGAVCTVGVDVVAGGVGILGNISGDLLADFVSAGKASASLNVTVTSIALRKAFSDDPVPPGGTVTLDFRIDNFDRFDSATGVAFTDDLTSALAGLTFSSILANNCGGSLSGVGTTTITFSGGTLAAGGSCTISTSLSVPAAAATGIYTNTTGAVSATVGGSPVVGNMASDILLVSPAPLLAKEFLDATTLAPDPVINAGDDVVIRFTIDNVSATSSATAIEFIDDLTAFLPFPVSVALPPTPNPPCGAGSSLALVSLGPDLQGLELTGGSLVAAPGAGSSCTFDVTVSTPAGLAPGIYVNTTRVITATVDGATATGIPASDTFTVIGAPQLSKTFIDDPVVPGGTVTLEFTLTYPPDASGDATVISFTDDLETAITGLAANLPPTPDPPCGAGSSLTGSVGNTILTFAGGTLSPGADCTFSVVLDVPLGVDPGNYMNTTSGVTATVQGLSATSPAASDDLIVSGLDFSKEFIGDPAVAGETLTLRFTIANVHPTDDATITSFTDNLTAALTGLAATGGPAVDTCGGALSGTTSLVYVGGSVLSGQTCIIEVPVLVPAGAADDVYLNTTSSLSATVGVNPEVVAPAVDFLTVDSSILGLTKEFTDDPVAPGDTATLEFTIDNLDATQAASSITFTDDLGAALTGLAAIGLPQNDVCGAGSQISGVGLLTLTGGNLPSGGSCTFSVTVQVPGGASAAVYTNTTSQVTGTIAGLAVTGDPASDDLSVSSFSFSKLFGGPVPAGGTTTLDFTIVNLDASSAAAGIAFSDDLDAVATGMMAVGLPASDVCGPGSLLSGTSFLTLTGGNLPPSGSCMFSVDVQVPAGIPPGTYVNTTSDLSQGGIPAAEPATADVVVEAALAGIEIPITTPLGTLVFVALIAAAAIWRLRWRV